MYTKKKKSVPVCNSLQSTETIKKHKPLYERGQFSAVKKNIKEGKEREDHGQAGLVYNRSIGEE